MPDNTQSSIDPRILLSFGEQRIRRIDQVIAFLHSERIALEVRVQELRKVVERADNISAGEPGPITRLGEFTKRKGQ